MGKNGTIKNITAMTSNRPDGMVISRAILEYDFELEDSQVSLEGYEVEKRTILDAYVSADVCGKEPAASGSFVVLQLSEKDETASVKIDKGPGGLRGPGPGGPPKDGPKLPGKQPGGDSMAAEGPMAGGSIDAGGPPKDGPKGPGGPGGPGGPEGPGGPVGSAAELRPVAVSVKQKADIVGVNGELCKGSDIFRISNRSICPVADEFRQMKLGALKFNLFVPEEYDPSRKYPLVLFIHDAGPCGDDPMLALAQGNGGLIWASPEEQKKHPCFVLCPQIPRGIRLTDDDFVAHPEIETIKRMIDLLSEQYSIDMDRIYTTGQSQGCMASLELGIRYPEFFAGFLLVAGQWDPARSSVLWNQNIWILVSEGDKKALPGMNAITSAFEEKGAVIGRYRWDAKMDPQLLNEAAAKAASDSYRIRYTVFEGSSVVPPEKEVTPATNHVCTWPVAYGIEAVRDWLFTSRRENRQG
ncbi:MAG: hypothetical protein LUD16_02950 [Lachnospiraceae bacterium]|nr:hypothetical protein [Lachnospiraceae bacterium]